MEIKIDWKKFEYKKPEIGKKILVKKDGVLYFGKFIGLCEIFTKSYGEESYQMDLKIIRTDLFSHSSYTIHNIYPKSQCEEGYNPHSFYWDYYNDCWE